MNYDDFKRPDPVLFLARRNDVVTHGSDKRARVPGEIWLKVASYCDYRTIDAFERAMFAAPGNPLLWSHLERPFNATISAMQPVRPMPAFGRLCRRGLPQETIDKLSLQDADRITESLSASCRESFLYLQVNSEKYVRTLVQYANSIDRFLSAAEPYHCDRTAVDALEEACPEFLHATARFTRSLQWMMDSIDSDAGMANLDVIFKQYEAGHAVADKFRAYWNGDAEIWMQGEQSSIEVLADADFRAVKTAAKQFFDLLSASSPVENTTP